MSSFVRGTQPGWSGSRPSGKKLAEENVSSAGGDTVALLPVSSVCLSLSVRLVRVLLRTVYSQLAVSLSASIVVASTFKILR